MLRGEPGAVRYSANLDKTCLAISPSPPSIDGSCSRDFESWSLQAGGSTGLHHVRGDLLPGTIGSQVHHGEAEYPCNVVEHNPLGPNPIHQHGEPGGRRNWSVPPAWTSQVPPMNNKSTMVDGGKGMGRWDGMGGEGLMTVWKVDF